MSVPVAVTIAGSDSGAGAGIQADLKTFAALGVYGVSVLTALTAQNTRRVFAIHSVPADFIAAQMDAVFSDFEIAAVKIGMLGNAQTVEVVASGLARHRARHVVLDPVMTASSGDVLLDRSAIAALHRLIGTVDVLTPNLPEAAELLNVPIATNEAEMRAQAEKLLALGASAVLIKGGHCTGPESIDLLVESERCTRFGGPRSESRNTHGTGCTLSAAIAAGLAKGLPQTEAVREAKVYVTAAIVAADRLDLGAGPGPLHHFHAWW